MYSDDILRSATFIHACHVTRMFVIDVIKWIIIHFFRKNRFYFSTYSPQLDIMNPAIFQLFYAFQMIRFVKPSKIPFCFPINFSFRLKTPTTQLFLEVWEQIIVAVGQIWRIPWMRKRFDFQFMLFYQFSVRCMRWWIVIMKKDFFSSNEAVVAWFRQPIDPEMQHNMLQ